MRKDNARQQPSAPQQPPAPLDASDTSNATTELARRAPATRRRFLKTSLLAAGASSVIAGKGAIAAKGPFIWASDKAGAKKAVIGSGEHTYVCHHGWGEVPSHISWGATHGVGIDAAGLIYIKHQNVGPQVMDAIAVFDPQGKFVRSFGKEYHGGGHGLDIRIEGGEEYLYLCDVGHRLVAKTNLLGENVWTKHFPTEPGVYKDESGFMPTNVAFHPDGGFYIGDGYGSNYIHQYDKDAKWIRTWGGEGDGPGKMRTPHGLWVDDRPGREPTLLVADRANARLQRFTLDGKVLGFTHDVSFPAHFDIRGSELLVPDLHARVSLFDAADKVIVHLGYDPEWTKEVLDGFNVRKEPKRWQDGKFVHPHDACFDKDGNIYVVEWVETGRVTKLERV